MYTWDHHSSALIWSGLKVQPILADEVQTFKALIMVHKILKDGHPVVSTGSDKYFYVVRNLYKLVSDS